MLLASLFLAFSSKPVVRPVQAMPAATTTGAKSLPITVTDAQARPGSGAFSLEIPTSPAAHDPSEHLLMGNPNGATADTNFPDNYLMMKLQYALSYNNTRRIPNWTSWHLDSTWRGSTARQDDYRADTTLPPGFTQVLETDYSGSGFDRGHMCPSADRTSSIADNSATFLMTNMVPQAPGNNQGPWAGMENDLRTLLPGSERRNHERPPQRCYCSGKNLEGRAYPSRRRQRRDAS